MKFKHLYAVITFCVMLLLSACSVEAPYVSIDGFAQGSTYHIVAQYDDADRIEGIVESVLDEIDNSISLYNKNSLLSQINSGVTDSVDIHISKCIETSETVSRLSGGAYDVTIKPITSAYGFTGDGEVKSPNIDSLMQYVGYEKIKIVDGHIKKESPNIQIDLNASAQGYTADMLGSALYEMGIDNYLVEIGGEITCRGVNSKGGSWNIGIDKPIQGNFVAGESLQTIIELTDKGLATSGNYRKFHLNDKGEKIVHTIDARTGESKESNLLSATVIAESALLADTYSTMMMVLGLEESQTFLENHPEIEAVLIYSDQNGDLQSFHSTTLKTRDQ